MNRIPDCDLLFSATFAVREYVKRVHIVGTLQHEDSGVRSNGVGSMYVRKYGSRSSPGCVLTRPYSGDSSLQRVFFAAGKECQGRLRNTGLAESDTSDRTQLL